MYGKFYHSISQYCKALYGSFYSSVLYADVVKRWHSLGMGYLLFLVILGAIPLSGRIIIEFNDFFKEQILFPFEALPSVTIQNGELRYNKPMPYLIKNKKGEVVSIIDTAGSMTELNQTYPQLTVLITKNKMDFRPASYKQFLGLSEGTIDNPIYTHIFDKGVNGLLSGSAWIHSSGITKLNTLMQILVFPSVVIFYFAVFWIMLLLLSALLQLYSDFFFNVTLSFKAACRLLAVAAIPALVLFFFMRCGNFAVPGMGLIYGVSILSYSSYGLYSVKRLSV